MPRWQAAVELLLTTQQGQDLRVFVWYVKLELWQQESNVEGWLFCRPWMRRLQLAGKLHKGAALHGSLPAVGCAFAGFMQQ